MLKIQSKFYHKGRLKPIRVIVIHDMESPKSITTAENCAKYFATIIKRKASAHICVDVDSAVRCVDDQDVAFHAPGANSDGLGIEHAGYARQSREEWLDDYNREMLKVSAKIVANWCRLHNIPPVKLSVDELKAGKRGLVGHVDVSNAYHQTDHGDPGPGFPWEFYLALVKRELNVTDDEDDMDQATFTEYLKTALQDKDVKQRMGWAVWQQILGRTATSMHDAIGDIESNIRKILSRLK